MNLINFTSQRSNLMIPLFRKIRKKLADDNKPVKYMRYAIGEIVLVVIGILIALSINNWNEERKAKEKLNLLFVKVQKELLYNVKEANSDIEDYRQKDSLIYKVLSREMNADDYMSNKDLSLMYLGTSYLSVTIVDNAYKSLIQFDTEISKQQDSILIMLKELYGFRKGTVNRMNKEVADIFIDFQKKIKYEKDWYYNMFSEQKYSDEIITYFLTDSFYFNHIVDVQNYGLDNHFYFTMRFRNMAISIYKKISEQLNLEKDSMVVKNFKDYKHYIGTYENLTTRIILKEEKDNLKLKAIRKKDSLVFGNFSIVPDSKAYFTIFNDDNANFGQLFFDKNNNVIGLRRSKGAYRRDFKKID